MSDSILTSTKRVLGILEDDQSFDPDVVMHVNSVLMVLNQLGIGVQDFQIEDAVPTWEDFLGLKEATYAAAKSYVFLRVKLIFDPPATSFAIAAMEKQIEEIGWRLNVLREGTEWTDPMPDLPLEEDL